MLEIYQETTKQTKAIVQLDCEGWGPRLQQIHPVATFIVIWAIIRDTAAVKPRPRAGLLGYEHWVPLLISTSEPCKPKNTNHISIELSYKHNTIQALVSLWPKKSIWCWLNLKFSNLSPSPKVKLWSHLDRIKC